MTKKDVVIIGGGAAGFFGAIVCAESAPGLDVLILEKSSQILSKVKISGGGRCNVTHDCLDPKKMATHYPRGNKALIGPLHRFGPPETIDWFESRGVRLKTEKDGRMFPVTDSSQTIIDCLSTAAEEAGVALQTSTGVRSLRRLSDEEQSARNAAPFEIYLDNGAPLQARRVLLATGGTRLKSSARHAESAGHRLLPAVPSLFTFHVTDPRIEELAGLSVPDATVRVVDEPLQAKGPLLITHNGFSGPAVLKLSAWGARLLHEREYDFFIAVGFVDAGEATTRLQALRREWGSRQIATRSPYETLPKRLWQRLVQAASIEPTRRWSDLTTEQERRLTAELSAARFHVTGKSTHKEEFVTCGGVSTDEVDMRTMESRLCPGLHFAGEVLDVDGITGGFNFQNAWTTGFLAGQAIAYALSS